MTAAQNRALFAAWHADPKVQAFAAAVRAHARQSKLSGVEGMTDALRFGAAWTKENGDLPESGIREF